MSILASIVTVIALTAHGIPADAPAPGSAVVAPNPDPQDPGPQDPGSRRPARSDAESRPAPLAPKPDGATPEPGAAVPEPGTLLLVGTGLVGLAVSSRRWRRAIPAGN